MPGPAGLPFPVHFPTLGDPGRGIPSIFLRVLGRDLGSENDVGRGPDAFIFVPFPSFSHFPSLGRARSVPSTSLGV